MENSETDVLILGGGVIGLACAHYLLLSGRSVRVIERGVVGSGSSHGNCGTITPSHAPPLPAPAAVGRALGWMLSPDAPLYVPPRLDLGLLRWFARFAENCTALRAHAATQARAAILLDSRRRLAELIATEQLDCEFSETGLVYAFRDAAQWRAMHGEVAALRQWGIEAQVWDAAQLKQEEPALRNGVAGGIFFAGDAQLRPDRYLAELARIVRLRGGVIEEGRAATGIRRQGERVVAVDTDAGPVRAHDYLFALGAWSGQWSRRLGLDLPIQPGKGYSITYSRPALTPRRPLVLKERSVCVTAWGSGFRLGSTMEFSGYDTRLNPVRLAALERAAREYLVEPSGPIEQERWYGWRPMSCDDVPLIGRSPRHQNLWLATGHGMMGVSMSAATGRLIADLLTSREPGIDPQPYSPARFAA